MVTTHRPGPQRTIKPNAAATDVDNSIHRVPTDILATALGTAPADAAKPRPTSRASGAGCSTLHGGARRRSRSSIAARRAFGRVHGADSTSRPPTRRAIDGPWVDATTRRGLRAGLVPATSCPRCPPSPPALRRGISSRSTTSRGAPGSIREGRQARRIRRICARTGDAQINITNNTPSFLVVNKPDQTRTKAARSGFNDILRTGTYGNQPGQQGGGHGEFRHLADAGLHRLRRSASGNQHHEQLLIPTAWSSQLRLRRRISS